mgnify:CR=1 FL=1
MKKKELKFNSLTIHGGQSFEETTGAVMPPIFGLAAIDAVIKLLQPGDELISTNDLYGGTYRLFTQIFEKYGIKFHFVPMGQAQDVMQYINANTKLIWVETPTNPMMNIIDIKAMSTVAKNAKALLVVDNTFATPYLQRPVELGADIVMHSATKYLGGHSDVVLGCLAVKDKEVADQLYFIQNSSGAVCGPMDAFLTLRGIKTLHVRMARHCENGKAVANFLRHHSKVEAVYWPVKGDRLEDAVKLVSNLKLITLAESLGGVESLAGHPVTMTHASIPKAEREKTGVTDGLIRLSVGIEDEADLLNDLEQALN